MTVEFADTEGAVRTYLRAHSDVSALVGTRVFFGIPDVPTWPLVVVAEQASIEDRSDAPVALDTLRIDCWGSLHADGHPDKAEARSVRDAVRQALYDLTTDRPSVSVGGDTVALDGAVLESSSYVPDPDNRRPRYVVVAQIAARLTASA